MEAYSTTWLSSFSLLFLIFTWLLLRSTKISKPKKTNLPPSPPKLPIIGNLHQLGVLPHQSLRDLSRKHGPLMLLRFGRVPTLVVSSAEMARQVMKTQDLDFASRFPLSSARKIFYGRKDVAFASYSEYWRQMKKICTVELLSAKRVQSFRFVRDEEVSNMMRVIRSSKGLGLNVRDLMVSLTNDLVCRVSFGNKCSGSEGVHELMCEIAETMGAFSFGDYFPGLGFVDVLTGVDRKQKGFFKRWDAFLGRVIEERLVESERDENEQRDFVDVLLHVQKHSVLDFPLTNSDIKAVIMDMIAAGTNTTSTSMEWIMAELVKHPQIMKKAQAEVRGIVGAKAKVDEMDTHQMLYLKAIIKETLRLHTAIPFLIPRECIRDTKLQGYDVPAKAMVYINAWAIGRDPTSWESPEGFQPERFLNSDLDFRGQDFMFLPFGAGRRGCPGISFAIATMELALANLLYQFDWALPPNGDLDMSETSGIATYKKTPLFLVATPHFN